VVESVVRNYVSKLSVLNGELLQNKYIQGVAQSSANLAELAPGRLATYEYRVNPWPFFINDVNKKKIELASIKIVQLIQKLLVGKWSQGHSLHHYYGLPELDYGKAINAPFNGNVIGRSDLYHDGSAFKLLEINLGTNVGGADMVYYKDILLAQLYLRDFLIENPEINFIDTYQVLIENALAAMRERQLVDDDGIFTIVIRNKQADEQIAQVYINLYQQIAQQMGCSLRVFVVRDEKEFQYADNHLYFQGHLVGFVAWLPEGMETYNIYESYPEELKKVWLEHNVLAGSNLLTHIIENNISLVLLYKHRNDTLFDDTERALIEEVVPETVLLSELDDDAFKRVKENKRDFVLKPLMGCQGNEVCIGRYVSHLTWSQYLAQARPKNNTVVQVNVTPNNIYAVDEHGTLNQCIPVFGSFFCGDSYASSWIRNREVSNVFDGVINSANGASEMIVFHCSI
jgi:glutathionylspermidine synthase